MFVPDAIAALRMQLAGAAAALDASRLEASDAARVVADAAAIESMAATVKSLAAKRVAETTAWRRDGDRSPAHHLARTTGTTIGEARELLDAAARLETLPHVDAAARRGELSTRQVAVISDAAATAPDAESRLIETARHASLGELRDECARTKAAALPDAEARHRAIHAGRFARRRSCSDGGAEVVYHSTADEVAVVWGVVERYREKAFARARREGAHESFDAYAADALLAMARAAVGGAGETIVPRRGSDAKVIVRIDHAALVRGRTDGDEVCEIAGLGPIAVSAVRDMVASGDAFVAAVVTKGADIASVVHLGRKPIALQRTALEWCSPTCSVLGCNQVAGLQIDHRLDWAETLHTTLRELDPLCAHHHNLKTRENWQLVAGTGKRRIVPPGHHDHPDARAGPRVPLTV